MNIDDLPAESPRDEYGFPILAAVPEQPKPGQSLADMTNDYQHVKGKLWAKAPKMKQQKAAMRVVTRLQGCADTSLIMDALTEVAVLFLFVEEGEQMRPATEDEIDEEFDMAELQELTSSLTGMGPQGAGSKN